MKFTYWGVPVVVLGYMGDKILIRMPGGGAPAWVSSEYVK